MIFNLLLFLFVIFLIVLWLAKIETFSFDVVEKSIPILKKSKSFTILQLSDTHFYKNLSPKFLQKLKKTLNKVFKTQKIDLICFTGDFLDKADGMDLLDEFFSFFPKDILKIAVLGNHDFEEKKFFSLKNSHLKKINQKVLNDIFQKYHIILLRDQVYQISSPESISILGFDSFAWSIDDHRCPLWIKQVEKTGLIIGISHYPDLVLCSQNIDLFLAGHTHGGQVTFFGYPIFPHTILGRKYCKGLHKIKNTFLYVNRGIGTSFYMPFRFFSRPEITLLHLISKGEL